MPDFYFARHGQSVANLDNVTAGASDSPLTEEGITQARHSAQEAKKQNLHFDRIIASSLSRAYDTAVIIASETGYPINDIVTSQLLYERHLGLFEGKSVHEFFASSEEEKEQAGCETLAELYARVKQANTFITKNAVGNTLIVAHSGFYRMAQCVAESLDPSMTYMLPSPKNGTIIKYPLEKS